MPMRFWRRWQAERELRRRAAVYVTALQREPPMADVAWLASAATAGDRDHARWELRYARWAIGLLVAERDALDDRTASSVAHQLTAALARDPNIAAEKLPVAQRQLNARLRRYGDALAARRSGEATGTRLGRALLDFATATRGAPPAPDEHVARAGELLSACVTDANEALRDAFGAASLPEDEPPSAVRGAAHSR
jgi:hypothetical protein